VSGRVDLKSDRHRKRTGARILGLFIVNMLLVTGGNNDHELQTSRRQETHKQGSAANEGARSAGVSQVQVPRRHKHPFLIVDIPQKPKATTVTRPRRQGLISELTSMVSETGIKSTPKTTRFSMRMA
jgi:hypothetical protein